MWDHCHIFLYAGLQISAPIDLRQRQWEGVIAMECIGRYAPNAPVNHPVYQSVPVPGDPLPPEPTLVSHPLYQSIVLAEALQRILAG